MFFFFKIYKQSVLATILSILGGSIIAVGIFVIIAYFTGEETEFGVVPSGIIMAAIGAGLSILASKVNENVSFKKWVKIIEEKNLKTAIAQSVQYAVEIYNTRPGKDALMYISNLNPQAGALIAQDLAQQKNKR